MFLQSKYGTGLAWLSQIALEKITQEIDATYPNETGGILIGYWANPSLQVVITDIVGPGPNAIHKKYKFEPDAKWQEQELARKYKESDRLYTYLGDWHNHPDGGLYLSRKDKKTLKRIAHYPDARIDTPLMLIISNKKNACKLGVFYYRQQFWFKGWIYADKYQLLTIKLFAPGQDTSNY